MDECTPFIKKIATEHGYFIYDTNTNRILQVDAAMFDAVDLYWSKSLEEIREVLSQRHARQQIDESYSRVHELTTTHRLFSPERLETRVGYPSEAEISRMLAKGVGQMCLEVTESCNLRCKYCAFSGGYDLNRTHGQGQMSWDTAKSAVDLYFTMNHKSDEELSLGFYGGEPLLRFDLIQSVVDYAEFRSTQAKQPIRFNFTTNATLLQDHVIRFCVDHGISIMISLDGPQQEHDRHRTYRNGQGTFSEVMSNLRHLRSVVPEGYYQTHILFSCVVTPATNYLALNQFFTAEPSLFRDRAITVGGVSPGNPTFLQNCEVCESQRADLMACYRMFYDTHVGRANHDLTFIRSLFERGLVRIHKRIIRSEPRRHEIISPACFPGSRKIFVDVRGMLHICERINHRFPIGDVISGINTARVKRVMDGFCRLMNAADCRSCWAVRLCTQCYATLAGDQELCQSRKDESCDLIRSNVEADLRTYCSVFGEKPTAWDYMNDIIVK